MSRTLIGLLFVATCLAPLIWARVLGTPSGDSPSRNRRQHSGNSNDRYGWVCPVVVCPAIPDTCETVEYFIMEHGHTTVGGQRVTVQCQSCEYCMDFPQQSNTDSARRGRRNANHHRRHDCTAISCPDVAPNCNDVRMTDVLLGNTKCRQCPACYDDTVFNRT